ncbi:M23 family metallopeptidase [Erythrobacter insulae]|uniref:M23 family metallopeptidase n=1 Tax=Erythrobacter insulae TaxID=2584124 RepID=A0A547PAX7_9SPHN|nr:M23 family metallopeptidase [Erythrobacter insulae]TRD11302.1 M23 family metallopeptidase [Erythrobacter insulae]
MAKGWIPLSVAGAAFAGLMSCAGAEAEGPEPVVAANPVEAGEPAPIVIQGQISPPDFEYAGELTQGGWIKGSVPYGTVSATLGGQPLELGDKDREFFAAFDRDSAGSLTLTAKLANGATYSEELTISPRKWNIQRVNVAKRGGGSSEAWWKKREPEWLAIKGAREKITGAAGWQQDFIWPVKGRISGQFGRQRIYRGEPGSYHSGIDIAPGNGVPFVAPADGVVVLARTGFSLEGNIIMIDHGAGLNSAFLHASKIAVKEGQSVRQGDHIGNVGATGRATGPHLHWSLKWNDARLDPLLLTGPMN